jgi:phosphatidylserine decarboxylase
MLSPYAKTEWLTVMAIGILLGLSMAVLGWWWMLGLVVLAMLLVLGFFRDPERRVPVQRGIVAAPADGRVSSIHRVEFFEPFDGPAVCVRIFLSVLDVHVNRCPLHAMVGPISRKPGAYLNALNPASAEQNESMLMVLLHPTKRHPIAAVRQVAGMLARTIVNAAEEGRILQRGQRFGIIKLGSTTELYLPEGHHPRVTVQQGQKVKGGLTVIATIGAIQDQAAAATRDRFLQMHAAESAAPEQSATPTS